MGNDLVKLYKDLKTMNASDDVAKVKKRIEDNLHVKMRTHFFELLEIGDVIGYEKLEGELQKAIELISQIKKK